MPPWQFIEAVQGANGSGAAIATHKITKTGGVNATFDAGAASVQTIAGDGFVEFLASNVSYKAIGLSVGNPGTNRDEIDYAVYVRNDGTAISFMSNGAVEASTNTPYAAGDVIRVQRVGTTVTAWINGELKHTYAVASAGALLVDTAMYNTGSYFDGIRLYDATSKSWPALTWQGVTNVTVEAGAAHTTRRVTFAAPTKMRAGDQLVMLLASQGPQFVSATSVTWGPIHTFTSETRRRGFAIYRRAVTDSEPSSYTFDLDVHQVTLGALLVYRDVDSQAALVAGDADDISATTQLQTPTVAVQCPSDLFVGGALVYNPQAQTVAPPAGAVERLEFTGNAPIGVDVLLSLYDMPTPYLGNTRATATISGLPAGASPSSFAFVLPGNPALGQGLAWKPLVAGAIGLPVEGI